MMDKAIVQGWGFVNHKKNPIQVLKTENKPDQLQFQTDVGGIFVAAQFDWENGTSSLNVFTFNNRDQGL